MAKEKKKKPGKHELAGHVAILRMAFGVMWGVDAMFKWMPSFRSTFLSNITAAAQGQPSWLAPWFNFWVRLFEHNPHFYASMTAVCETLLALALIFGIARRTAYLLGALFSVMIWAVAEGFGGPYTSSSTDIGTAIIYAVVLLALYGLDRLAVPPSYSLDNYLVKKFPWWAVLSQP